jgi:hypothetical protein
LSRQIYKNVFPESFLKSQNGPRANVIEVFAVRVFAYVSGGFCFKAQFVAGLIFKCKKK